MKPKIPSCYGTKEYSDVSAICRPCKLKNKCLKKSWNIKHKIKKLRKCRARTIRGKKCQGIVFVDNLCFNHWMSRNKKNRKKKEDDKNTGITQIN